MYGNYRHSVLVAVVHQMVANPLHCQQTLQYWYGYCTSKRNRALHCRICFLQLNNTYSANINSGLELALSEMFLSHTGKSSAQMMVPNGISESTSSKSCQMADLKVQATNHTKRQRWESKLQFMPECTGESASYIVYQKAEVRVQTTYHAKRQSWKCKLQIKSKGRGGSASYKSCQRQRWECKLHITPKGRGESANYISCQNAEVRVQATNHAKRQRWEYKLQTCQRQVWEYKLQIMPKAEDGESANYSQAKRQKSANWGSWPRTVQSWKWNFFYCLWCEKLNIFISVGALPSDH